TNACQMFKSKPDAVERLRNALADLNRGATADLASFLLGPPPATPPHYQLFYILSIISIVCPFGLIISPWFLPPTVGLWILNIVLHCHFGQGVLSHRRALKSLAIMLGCVPKISHALHEVDLSEAKEIQTTIEAARSVQKQISRAFLRDFKGDDLTAAIGEYLNLLCLFELRAFCRAFRLINQNRPTLVRIMRIVARLDAFQGLATTLSDYPSICVPEFQPGRGFAFTDVYHPLVAQPVANTIECNGRSIILSGTNMAGKTTFIKTLGLNVVLAQTIGFCLARKAILPPARVKTLIERQDTIITGQSYFFFEATELLRMFKDAEQSEHELWFVLDEVFRGTNAVEQVAAGAAVLNHLNQSGFVVASTHDQELNNLLQNEFDSYHFSEVIQG
ncbi:MAG TPA: hypothetical protein VKA67_07000, partial [Verrucomicrobiae bacterium]|nr:hypothetical protein [Verrucomicrobiae bacterium]